MRKTTSYPSSSSDALSVDTAGLQKMLNSGRQTAIGMNGNIHQMNLKLQRLITM